jgi:hypothetical protein
MTTPPAPLRAASVHAQMLRAVRLDATGHPLVGPDSMYTSNNLVKLDYAAEVQAGAEVSQVNGQGQLCVTFRGLDTIKWLNLTLQLCDFDPELIELLVGGTVLVDQANTETVGYAMPPLLTPGQPNGVALELWSKQIRAGAVVGFWRHVFPRAWLRQGDRSLGDGAMEMAFSGFASSNPNYGKGGNNDWNYPSDRMWQVAQVDQAELPVDTLGYQAVAAPGP